jgi:hypothetical protein
MEKRWDFYDPKKTHFITGFFYLSSAVILGLGLWLGLQRNMFWLVAISLVLGLTDLFIALTVHPVSFIILHDHHITVNNKSYPLAKIQIITLFTGKILFQSGHSKTRYIYPPSKETNASLDELSSLLPELSDVTVEDKRVNK